MRVYKILSLEDNFKVTEFPDGQIYVEILDHLEIDDSDIKFVFKPKSSNDFIALMQAVDIIDNLQQVRSHRILFMPYLMGARSDRRFNERSALSVMTYANIINSLGFDKVEILNPHSSVSTALIKNLKVLDSSEQRIEVLNFLEEQTEILNILSPDKGASDKVLKIYHELNAICKNPPEYLMLDYPIRIGEFLECSKSRAANGDITGVKLPQNISKKLEGDIIIFDDICDGGRTFIVLAEEIRKTGFKGKLFLYIDHAIMSKGLQPLFEHFEYVFTTDSTGRFSGGEHEKRLISYGLI